MKLYFLTAIATLLVWYCEPFVRFSSPRGAVKQAFVPPPSGIYVDDFRHYSSVKSGMFPTFDDYGKVKIQSDFSSR
jgi:hypothetical protein